MDQRQQRPRQGVSSVCRRGDGDEREQSAARRGREAAEGQREGMMIRWKEGGGGVGEDIDRRGAKAAAAAASPENSAFFTARRR